MKKDKPLLWWKNGHWHVSASKYETSYDDWKKAFTWTLWRNMDGSRKLPKIDPDLLDTSKEVGK